MVSVLFFKPLKIYSPLFIFFSRLRDYFYLRRTVHDSGIHRTSETPHRYRRIQKIYRIYASRTSRHNLRLIDLKRLPKIRSWLPGGVKNLQKILKHNRKTLWSKFFPKHFKSLNLNTASRDYINEFSKAYKILYRENMLCYLTEILDSAQEGIFY